MVALDRAGSIWLSEGCCEGFGISGCSLRLGFAGSRAIADIDTTLAVVSWFGGGLPVAVGPGSGE